MWFTDKSSYANISALDKVSTVGLEAILDGTSTSDKVTLKVTKPSGETIDVECRHTLSADQIEWLRFGSALNYIGHLARS